MEFLLERLFYSHGIEGYCFDEQGEILFCRCTEEETVLQKAQTIHDRLTNKEAVRNYPQIFYEETGVYFWEIQSEGKSYLFGPIAGPYFDSADMGKYRFANKIRNRDYLIPRSTQGKMLGLIALSHYILTGEEMSEQEIQSHNAHVMKPDVKDDISYQLYRHEEEKSRASYEVELQWMNRIENGIFEEDADIDMEHASWQEMEQIGTMAMDDFKQMEYMTVSSITLATRAAIRGGVEARRCYDMSDLYLQKVAKCSNVMEILRLGTLAANEFTRLVHEKKEEQRLGTIVERCKNYVARELYHPFTISKMADDLAVNRSYMSKCFSERMGMTLHDYITEERLNAAANLLKYSESSVAQIADYMQFSSAGRFAGYFKKKYGVTPTQYRQMNKDNSFHGRN